MTSTIEKAFDYAVYARQLLEDDYTDDNLEAFEEARGAFRMTVIAQMRSELKADAERYTVLAEEASELYECILALDKWFKNNGVPSDVSPLFIRDTKLPQPLRGVTRDYCGTKTRLRSTRILNDEGMAMFDGNYRFYDDQERMPPAPGSQNKNKAKALNAGLGR